MYKIGHTIWDYLYERAAYIALFATVILGILQFFNFLNWEITIKGYQFFIGYLLLFLMVFLALIFGFCSIEKTKKINELLLENETLKALLKEEKENLGNKISEQEDLFNTVLNDMSELLTGYLRIICYNLNFTHNERVSIYKVRENKFLLIGRSSTNPELEKTGRSSYPTNEGFIGKCWQESYFFVKDIPNVDNFDEYYDRINAIFPIDKEVIRNLKMKSRNFLIKRIDGNDNKPKAVIVFESKNPDSLKKEEINKLLYDSQPSIISFVEKMNYIKETESETMKEKGF